MPMRFFSTSAVLSRGTIMLRKCEEHRHGALVLPLHALRNRVRSSTWPTRLCSCSVPLSTCRQPAIFHFQGDCVEVKGKPSSQQNDKRPLSHIETIDVCEHVFKQASFQEDDKSLPEQQKRQSQPHGLHQESLRLCGEKYFHNSNTDHHNSDFVLVSGSTRCPLLVS